VTRSPTVIQFKNKTDATGIDCQQPTWRSIRRASLYLNGPGFESSCGHIFDIQFFSCFPLRTAIFYTYFTAPFEFRSQSMIEVVYGIYVYAMTISLVGRLGSGARSWDRIGLGDKVRVTASAIVTTSHT